MTLYEYLLRLAQAAPAIVKGDMQRIGIELGAYIGADYMLQGSNPTPGKKRTDADPRLYTNTNTLLKAATVPGQGANKSTVTVNGTTINYVFDIDLREIPYARIHEYGGKAGAGLKANIPARPYVGPAFEAYIKEGLADLTERMMQRIVRAAA